MQSIKNFISSLFIKWMLSEKGVAVLVFIWGVLLPALTHFTHILEPYAPLSYGIAASIGLILGLCICKLWDSLFSRRKTSKPTFVECIIENNALRFVNKSNIFKTPYMPELITGGGIHASVFIVIFEQPINSSHMEIEAISGTTPSMVNTTMDESFAYFSLANICNPSRFKIHFKDR